MRCIWVRLSCGESGYGLFWGHNAFCIEGCIEVAGSVGVGSHVYAMLGNDGDWQWTFVRPP
jgi:hypothetical protein